MTCHDAVNLIQRGTYMYAENISLESCLSDTQQNVEQGAFS